MVEIIHVKERWKSKLGSYENKLVIYDDNWNDYSYRTLFHVVYFDTNGNTKDIGDIKIYYYDFDKERTNNYDISVSSVLDDTITYLDETKFCSLGQSLSFYKNLKECIPVAYIEVLDRLNDIATKTELRKRYINEDGVQISLLRDSSAEKAMNEASEFLSTDRISSKDVSFRFEASVPYSEYTQEMYFDFKRNDEIPHRINIIIGKNGTGKTHILYDLANSLSGITKWKKESNDFERPPIDKVISISYSAFDVFKKRPKPNREDNYKSNSYVYCGIQSEGGTLSLQELDQTFLDSFQVIKEKNRINAWDMIMKELVGDEYLNIRSMVDQQCFKHGYYSSGEHILICTITEVLAKIENESLILFDEPEIHLHPNAVASVMRMFYRLLNEFDSYAIFATHSPLIVQETPSKYIHVLERLDNSLIVRHPDVECFGENITNITDEIFDVKSNESNYKTVFDILSQNMEFEKVQALFEDKLSFNALIYLKNCYNKKK